MKTHKELLMILLNNIHLLETGLCDLAKDLFLVKVFTRDEKLEMERYIYHNRPHNLRSEFSTRFFWKPGKQKPRVKWLEKQIMIETNK